MKLNNNVLQFLTSNQKAQKHLLGAFELLVGKSFPEKLMPKVPRLLQLLYDKDFLEEEVLVQWAAKVSSPYFYDSEKKLFKLPF